MTREQRLRIVMRLYRTLRIAEDRRDLVAAIVLRQRIEAVTAR